MCAQCPLNQHSTAAHARWSATPASQLAVSRVVKLAPRLTAEQAETLISEIVAQAKPLSSSARERVKALLA